KYDLEFLRDCSRIFQETELVLLAEPASQLCLAQIFFDRQDRLSILFDKKSRVSAATERLDTECAGSGKKIEHPRANHDLAEAGENRCFHPVHRWAHAILRRHGPTTAAP